MKAVWILTWNTESGDEGVEGFWVNKPTAKAIQKAIVGNEDLRSEFDSGTLHFGVELISSLD